MSNKYIIAQRTEGVCVGISRLGSASIGKKAGSSSAEEKLLLLQNSSARSLQMCRPRNGPLVRRMAIKCRCHRIKHHVRWQSPAIMPLSAAAARRIVASASPCDWPPRPLLSYCRRNGGAEIKLKSPAAPLESQPWPHPFKACRRAGRMSLSYGHRRGQYRCDFTSASMRKIIAGITLVFIAQPIWKRISPISRPKFASGHFCPVTMYVTRAGGGDGGERNHSPKKPPAPSVS